MTIEQPAAELGPPPDLLPCPFCGGPGDCELHSGDDDTWVARCKSKNCPCWPSTDCHKGYEAAIAAWNTRAVVGKVSSSTIAITPGAWMLEWSYDGDEVGTRLYDDERHCLADAQDGGGVCVALYRADAPILALVQEVLAIGTYGTLLARKDNDG